MGGKDSLIGRLLGNAEKFTEEQVTQTISLLIEHGIKRNATDIHIEPREQYALVRYRIDGSLTSIHKLPLAALPAIIAQIKTLAHLRPAETEVPQEGEYVMKTEKRTYDVQVATLPVVAGEKIVLHLRQQDAEIQPLEALGLWGPGLQAVWEVLARPHGLVIVAGPKRNGVSTTLRSLLNLLNTPNISVATVENRIEHRISGVNQTQAAPRTGIGFLEGLQAVLRQDPNVIMLSNLPDAATTELAIHAATTGHLLLAGVHADTAVNALLHMQTSGVQPFLLTAATRLVVAQRLVRKLCPECRERYELSTEERAAIEKTFGITTASARKRLHELEQQAADGGMGSKQLNTTASHPAYLWRVYREGCEFCNHTGYQGRIALTEVMVADEPLRTALLSQPNAAKIEAVAQKTGFIPLYIDGLLKALRGETTVEEVLRHVPRPAT